MTYYPGGKKRIGKEIAETIINYVSREVENGFKLKGYCEPFCGMLGVYQYVPELMHDAGFKKLKYIASDRNPYIIKLWKGLQNGWIPPSKCTEAEFYRYKQQNNESLKGIFCGFAGSFQGVFRCVYYNKNNVPLLKEHCVEIATKLKNVNIIEGTYDIHNNLEGYILYCDPPYKDTPNRYHIKNKYATSFDYNKFTEWIKKVSQYNIVFVSEYTKPCKGAKQIWSNGKEKLFVL